MIRRMFLRISRIDRSEPVSRITAHSADGLKVVFEAPAAWMHEATTDGAIVMDLSFHRAIGKETPDETIDYDGKFMRLLGAESEKRS